MRSKLERVPAILASATPAIETRQMAEIGVYAEVKLPDRYGVAEMPDIAAIDFLADQPPRGRWLAPTLVREIATTSARGEQNVPFRNRRCSAPPPLCRHSGHPLHTGRSSCWDRVCPSLCISGV